VCAIGVFAASKAELRGQLGNKGPAGVNHLHDQDTALLHIGTKAALD